MQICCSTITLLTINAENICAAKYFVESVMHFFGYFDNRRTKFIWNRNVFNPTFYKFNMSLLNKNTYFFKNKSYCPQTFEQ